MRAPEWIVLSAVAFALSACGGGGKGEDAGDGGDLRDGDATDRAGDLAEEQAADSPGETTPEAADDSPGEVTVDPVDEDASFDAPDGDAPAETVDEEVEWDGPEGTVDRLGTNNQDIAGVERVIFLGDSITATPYFTPPWSDRIRDELRGRFGSGLEIVNLARGGARTEHVLGSQLPSINTASTKKTLVMFTIGGNDALQVMGEDADTTLAHMLRKIGILEEIIQWLVDPAHFPGGVDVVYSNVYDPTDGVGDFTHCGVGVYSEDWPEVVEVEPVLNARYLELAMTYGVDMLDLHGLFLGHGFHNNDAASPHYCHGCAPSCPCPRWFDFSCIHPNADGHENLAGFFYQMVAR